MLKAPSFVLKFLYMNGISEVRPSPIAGRWYEGNPDRLRAQIDAFLENAVLPELPGEVVALIAPHAGHIYSGRTAGFAFASVAGQERELVAVLSPMHAPYPADLLTTAHRAYATPLGQIPVDREAVDALGALLAHDGMELTAVANDREHALEIELPFLQRALRGSFHLLPVMVRSQSPQLCHRLGQALAKVMKKRHGLLIASTDLSHFYPEATANQLDQEMLRRMQRFDPEALFVAEQTGAGFACGVGAVAAVLWAARELGADTVEIVHHSTSGDETGDYESVVGYGAGVVLKHA